VRDQLRGRAAELLGLGAHQLPADGMVVRADLQHPVAELPPEEDQLVEDDLGHGELGAPAAGDDAHRPIGVARQRRLDGGKPELKGPDLQHYFAFTS
jgi:hypothetical protein